MKGAGAFDDVRGVTVDSKGTVWVATKGGLGRVAKGKIQPLALETINGPTFDVATDEQGQVWLGAWNGLYRVNGDTVAREEGLDFPIGRVKPFGKRLIVSASRGLWRAILSLLFGVELFHDLVRNVVTILIV